MLRLACVLAGPLSTLIVGAAAMERKQERGHDTVGAEWGGGFPLEDAHRQTAVNMEYDLDQGPQGFYVPDMAAAYRDSYPQPDRLTHLQHADQYESPHLSIWSQRRLGLDIFPPMPSSGMVSNPSQPPLQGHIEEASTREPHHVAHQTLPYLRDPPIPIPKRRGRPPVPKPEEVITWYKDWPSKTQIEMVFAILKNMVMGDEKNAKKKYHLRARIKQLVTDSEAALVLGDTDVQRRQIAARFRLYNKSSPVWYDDLLKPQREQLYSLRSDIFQDNAKNARDYIYECQSYQHCLARLQQDNAAIQRGMSAPKPARRRGRPPTPLPRQ